MDDEIKVRLEASDKVTEHLEKRFDDLKWYFGGAATLFTVIFSVFTLLLSWNYKSERDSLREFETDIKKDLGKVDAPAQLDVFGVNGLPLADQEVETDTETDKDGSVSLKIVANLRNSGGATTGPIFLKLYTNDPIQFDAGSTDEPKYKYETYIYKNIDPTELPGGVSFQYFWTFFLRDKSPLPPPGNYKSLIKLYYGKSKITQAPFTIVIKKK